MPQDGASRDRTDPDGADRAVDDPLRCGYTLTPDDVQRDEDDDVDRFDEIFHGDDRDDPTIEGDRWVCHRRVRETDDRCVFHAHDTDDTVECEVDAAEVLFDIVNGETDDRAWNADGERDGLWEVVREDGDYGREEFLRRQGQFVGASVGEVTLSYERLNGPKAYPIDLRCGRAESLRLRGARVEHTLDLRGFHQTDPDGELDTYGTRIDPLLKCQHAVIEDDVVADYTETDGAYFDGAEVSGDLSVGGATVRGAVRLRNAEIQGDVSLEDATVEGSVKLQNAEVTGGLSLARSRVGWQVRMEGATVAGEGDRDREYDVKLDSLTIESDIIADGRTDLPDLSLVTSEIGNNVELHGRDTEDGATVRGDVSLDNTTVAGLAKFQNTETRGDLSLEDATVERSVWLHDAEIRGGLSLARSAVGWQVVIEGTIVKGEGDRDREYDAKLNSLTTESDIIANGRTDLPDLSLVHSQIGNSVSFYGSDTEGGPTIQGDLSLNYATVERSAKLQNTEIQGDLSLEHTTIEGPAVFGNAQVTGDLSLEDATVDESVWLHDAEVTGGLSLARAEVGWQVMLEGTTVEGEGDRDRQYDVSFRSLTTESDITADGRTDLPDLLLDRSEIGGNVALREPDTEDGVTVRGDLSMEEMTVEESVWLHDAEVTGGLSLARSAVGWQVIIKGTTVEGKGKRDRKYNVKLNSLTTEADIIANGRTDLPDLSLVHSEIGNNLSLYGPDTEDGATIRGDLSLDYATVERSVKFQDAEVRGDLSMTRVDVKKRVRLPDEVHGDVVVDGISAERLDVEGTVGGRLAVEDSVVPELNVDCTLTHPAVDVISLAGTTVDEGALRVAEDQQTVYEFADAVLGDVRIAPEQASHCDHARFLETGFDGFDFSSEREGFRRAGWNVHEPHEHAARDIAVVQADVWTDVLEEYATPLAAARALAASLVVGAAVAAADEDTPPIEDLTVESAVDAYRRWIESGETRPGEGPPSGQGARDGPAVDDPVPGSAPQADGGVEGPLFATEEQQETFESEPQQVRSDAEYFGLSGSQTVLDGLRDVAEHIDVSELTIAPDATRAEDVVAGTLDRLDEDETTRAVEELEAAIAREIADPDRVRGDDSRIESTYARAKEGASAVGDETAAGEFFQREARFSRSQHWNRGTGERGPVASVLLFVLWTGGALAGLGGLGAATAPALAAATGDVGAAVDATTVAAAALLSGVAALVGREVASGGRFRRVAIALPWGAGGLGIGILLADVLGAAGTLGGAAVDQRLLGGSLVVLSLTALGGRTVGDNGRLRAYLGNVFLGLTMGYGEKPLRVLGLSTVIVVAFAYGYRVAYVRGIERFDGVRNFDPSSWLDYLSLSLEMFVSLLINQPTIGNEWVQLAAQIEGFLGVFVAGMFVVAVTRAVHR